MCLLRSLVLSLDAARESAGRVGQAFLACDPSRGLNRERTMRSGAVSESFGRRVERVCGECPHAAFGTVLRRSARTAGINDRDEKPGLARSPDRNASSGSRSRPRAAWANAPGAGIGSAQSEGVANRERSHKPETVRHLDRTLQDSITPATPTLGKDRDRQHLVGLTAWAGSTR